MVRLAPLDLDKIEDSELRDLIAQCEELGVPHGLFPRIVARVPAQAKVVIAQLIEAHTKGNVPHRLKELMRIQLARFVDDPYFASLRSTQAVADGMTEEMVDAACEDYEDSELFDEAERMALRFSEQLFLDADKVDKVFYDALRKHWSDAEIMEMGAFIATYYAVQLFMKTLDAGPVAA
jgi:alkylhydroperoxidase family enzyme